MIASSVLEIVVLNVVLVQIKKNHLVLVHIYLGVIHFLLLQCYSLLCALLLTSLQPACCMLRSLIEAYETARYNFFLPDA